MAEPHVALHGRDALADDGTLDACGDRETHRGGERERAVTVAHRDHARDEVDLVEPVARAVERREVRRRRDERSEEHTSELQSLAYLVCRLLLGKKKKATWRH